MSPVKDRLICVDGPLHGRWIEIERGSATYATALPMSIPQVTWDPESETLTTGTAYYRRERFRAPDPAVPWRWLERECLVPLGRLPDVESLRDALMLAWLLRR